MRYVHSVCQQVYIQAWDSVRALFSNTEQNFDWTSQIHTVYRGDRDDLIRTLCLQDTYFNMCSSLI